MNTSTIEIELDQDLDDLLFRLSHLRQARRQGERERINRWQQGQLNWQQIRYHIVRE